MTMFNNRLRKAISYLFFTHNTTKQSGKTEKLTGKTPILSIFFPEFSPKWTQPRKKSNLLWEKWKRNERIYYLIVGHNTDEIKLRQEIKPEGDEEEEEFSFWLGFSFYGSVFIIVGKERIR